MVSRWSISDLYVRINAPNNRDQTFVSYLVVLSCIFFDQHGDVRNDGGISFGIFQRAVVPGRAAVRKSGLDLQRLCDCCRGFDAPSDLDRVDDRREDRIPDDDIALAQADRHSGDALLLRGNGDIAGPDAEPMARPSRLWRGSYRGGDRLPGRSRSAYVRRFRLGIVFCRRSGGTGGYFFCISSPCIWLSRRPVTSGGTAPNLR